VAQFDEGAAEPSGTAILDPQDEGRMNVRRPDPCNGVENSLTQLQVQMSDGWDFATARFKPLTPV
jgi:hypothetical protein